MKVKNYLCTSFGNKPTVSAVPAKACFGYLKSTAELAEQSILGAFLGLFFFCGDWRAVRGTFVWTFNGPPAGLPVVPPPPFVKSPKQTWHQEHLGVLSIHLSQHILFLPLCSPFLSKDNFGEYFMGYIASVSPRRAGRVARDDDWQARTPASARRQPFFLVCRPDTPTPFSPSRFFPSVTDNISFQARVWLLIV